VGGRDDTAARRSIRKGVRAANWVRLLDLAQSGDQSCREAILAVLSEIDEGRRTLSLETADTILSTNEWACRTPAVDDTAQQVTVELEDAEHRQELAEHRQNPALFAVHPPKKKRSQFKIFGAELEFAQSIKARFNSAFGVRLEAELTSAQAKAIYLFARKYSKEEARIVPWVQRMTKTVGGEEWTGGITHLFSLWNGKPEPYWEWLKDRHERHRVVDPQVVAKMREFGDLEIYRAKFKAKEVASA
jgi:hypothetical protein